MRLRFPCILSKQRTEEGKKIRRLYRNDVGVPYQLVKGYAPRTDGCCNTIATFTTDNNIIYLNDMRTRPEYKPNPTKEDLRDYFAPRVAVRKMVPKEAGRLMGLSDREIELIQAYPFKSYEEKGRWEATATKKERNKMKRQMIAKTSQFKLFGNSIVVQVLEALFFKLFIDTSNPNKKPTIREYTIFDYC